MIELLTAPIIQWLGLPGLTALLLLILKYKNNNNY